MDTTKLTKELFDLENRYWQAIKDKDVETAVALTDFPCLVVGQHGARRVEEPAYKEMMKDATYELTNFELKENPEVRLISDDVAIIAYTAHEEMTVQGKAITREVADSSTWVRRDGKWVCALHSEAVVK